MATMGKYCKAYALKKLREFNAWTEKSENARKEKQPDTNQEIELVRELSDDDYVYLQENYVVTDDIFKDENVIFDNVTPAWITYCQEVLEFKIPDYAVTDAA